MSFENQGNLSGQQRDNKKKKIVIAQVDIDQQARDIGEERLLSSKAELKGFGGFLRKVWKHNLAHEFYRQRAIAKAKQEIQQSGNLYVGEKGEKADHENAMNAIVQRLAMEYDDEFSRGGEEEKNLRDENPEEKNLKKDVQDLIKNFATGKISEKQFNLEKNKLFNVKLDGIKDLKGKDFAKKGSLYADNLLEVAKQIKDNISHNKGLDALDKDFEIVLSKAKAGVDTEANYNNIDKIIEKIQKSAIGKLFGNEVAISLGVSAIYGVAVKGSISAAQKTVKWVAPVVGMAASAGIGGAVAGFRENKRIKDERAQHGREMAKGGKDIEEGSENREEMEKTRHETKDATELSDNLQKALEELKNQPDEKKFSEVLDKYNEIGFRVAVASRDKIDLISFSDAKKVEEERTNMYKICSETKAYLEENAGKGLANFCHNNKDLEDKIKQGRLAKIENFAKEKAIKDEIFNNIKSRKVKMAVAKGAAIGLAASLVVQEIGAATGISGGSRDGLFNSNGAHPDGQVRSLTLLKACRDYIFGDTPKMPSANGSDVMQEHIMETKNYVENHRDLFSSIKRGVWADNDTLKPDKNELKMHWGGEKGSGVDANGNYVFNIKHMTHSGSFHGGKHWDPQELMKEGKIKMLISLSKDTQNQVVEIPFDANGNAIIDPNSEIGKLAFENIDGHAKFIGKFAEVAVMGENKDGIDSANVLATLKGEGIDGVSYVIPKPEDIPADYEADYEIDTPYVIPIVPHVPMEKLKEKDKKEIENKIGKIEENIASLDYAIAKETDTAKREKLEKERLIGQSREAAMHTLYKLKEYIDLLDPNKTKIERDKDGKLIVIKTISGKEEVDNKFLELTRELWDELAIHERPDRDANACLKLMELAGIKADVDKMHYVKQGKFSKSGITMDSSMTHGVIAEEGGKQLIFDHHGEKSGRDTSAAKFVYETLVEMGLLKKEKYLDNYVEFITKCDNMNFAPDEMKQVYHNYPKNLYGLSYRMKTADILELFKNGVDPKKDLPDDYLNSHEGYNLQNGGQYEPLAKLAEHIKKQMENGKKSLEKLEKAGFVFDTGNDRFGKILIDTKKSSAKGKYYYKVDGENNSNQMEVFLKGYGGYLVWAPEEKSFVLYTQRKMDKASLPGGFSQGFNMRGNMWMKSMNDSAELSVTLEEIFSKLSGKSFRMGGRLKETLDRDAAGKEALKFIDENKLNETEIKRIAKEHGISLRDLLYSILSNNRNKISNLHEEKMKNLSVAGKKDNKKMEAVVLKILLKYQEDLAKNGKNGNNGQVSLAQTNATPIPQSKPANSSKLIIPPSKTPGTSPGRPISPPNIPVAPQIPSSPTIPQMPPAAPPNIPAAPKLPEQITPDQQRQYDDGLKIIEQANKKLFDSFNDHFGKWNFENKLNLVNAIQKKLESSKKFKKEFSAIKEIEVGIEGPDENYDPDKAIYAISTRNVKMENRDLIIDLKIKSMINKSKPTKSTAASQMPPQAPPLPDQQKENISNSAKKIARSFSNFELSSDAIKEEAKAINVSPAILARQFIQENDELRPLYEARKSSINEQNDNAVEKLAMTVILENEKRKLEEKIKTEGESDVLNMKLIEVGAELTRIEFESMFN